MFTAAEIEQIAGFLNLSVPAGDTISISDTAANIEAITPSQLSTIIAYTGLAFIHATNASIGLTAAQADLLEGADPGVSTPIPVTTHHGDLVTLTDTAADIEAMTPAQLGALTSIGITQVDVTDASLTLTVAQALALYDPVPIVVPPGDAAIIMDTEAAVESLTPVQLVGLAGIGITTIEVSNLTAAAPLLIDGGLILAVGGPVPGNQQIDFIGTGGTLAVSDTPDMAATLFGFSPPDTLDLTDIAYDPASTADITGSNQIEVDANGNTYDIQLDPTQVFVTETSVNTAPDSLTGTAITLTEAPLPGYALLSAGQTSDGLVIQNGGVLEVGAGAAANRVMIQNGGVLLVDGGGAAADTFIGDGALADFASAADSAGLITFDATTTGGTLELDDTSTLASIIMGFAPGDMIDLTAFEYDPNGSAAVLPGNVLELTENGSTYDLQLDPAQSLAGLFFTLSEDQSGNDGTLITETTVACYARGTRIATPSGEVTIECLAIGDLVQTQSGASRPIKWIGRRSYAPRFAARNPAVQPVLIRAGALAPNVPRRDLTVSPLHAMYLDGALIPACDLVNGLSILRVPPGEPIHYIHLEFETHDVVLAEGAPSESFIDDGSRQLFHNAAEFQALYPKARPNPAAYYAPRLSNGPLVETVRRRILKRAGGVRQVA